MKFSVITPSFRNSDWLKLCIASVADQEGVALEHIVQDACSDDGTQEWLPNDPRVKAFIEKDAGMYDALNRGFRRASGDILCHLNSDEQYLPGALAAVAAEFEKHPEIDILAADVLVVDTSGEFICYRKSMVPWRILKWTAIPTNTAALFYRRSTVEKQQLFFDTRYKGIADALWIRRAIDLGLHIAVLRQYTSTFTESGENLSLKPLFFQERAEVVKTQPTWTKLFRWFLIQLHRMRKVANGSFSTEPIDYSIYTLKAPSRRTDFHVEKSTGIWWQRHPQAKANYR